jgi:hypothetical protein
MVLPVWVAMMDPGVAKFSEIDAVFRSVTAVDVSPLNIRLYPLCHVLAGIVPAAVKSEPTSSIPW